MSTATSPRRMRHPAKWVLLLPFVVMFTLFFVAPIVYAIAQSMFATKSSGLGLGRPETTFVLFDNYARALADPAFVESVGRLVAFAAIEVPLMVLTALGLALLLDSGSRCGKLDGPSLRVFDHDLGPGRRIVGPVHPRAGHLRRGLAVPAPRSFWCI